jgi:hypothetical protein
MVIENPGLTPSLKREGITRKCLSEPCCSVTSEHLQPRSEAWASIPGMGRGEIKENEGGVNHNDIM